MPNICTKSSQYDMIWYEHNEWDKNQAKKRTRKIKIANWLSYKTTVDVNKYIERLDDSTGLWTR